MSHAFLSKLLYKKFPQILSFVFHPLLMPTLGVFIILNSGIYIAQMPLAAKNIVLIIVLACTFGLPAALVPIYYFGKIKNQSATDLPQERITPLAVTALFYYLSYYLLRKLGVPGMIQTFILSSSIAVCVNLCITLKWKISAHMIGIGGVIGLIVSLSLLQDANINLFLMIAILLGGLIGFSRLSLNAHTPTQVYSGLATGFMVTLFAMLFL